MVWKRKKGTLHGRLRFSMDPEYYFRKVEREKKKYSPPLPRKPYPWEMTINDKPIPKDAIVKVIKEKTPKPVIKEVTEKTVSFQ